MGVLAQEEADQVVEVPQRVVDRRRRQQQQVPPPAEHQRPQGRRPRRRIGIPVVVGLVDDHELILVERALQVLLPCLRTLRVPKLPVARELLERQALDEQLIRAQELLPRGVPQRRGADQQGPLSPLPVDLEDLTRDERLSQADLVGDDAPPRLPNQPERAGHSVFLKAGERQVVVDRGVVGDLLAIQAPEHVNEDLPGPPRPKDHLEDVRQVVGLGLLPQLVEPRPRPLDDGPVVAPEVELQVVAQARRGQVRRAGDDALRGAERFAPRCQDVRLGVQECPLIAPHLHFAAAKRRDERAQRRRAGPGVRQPIALPAQAVVHSAQTRAKPTPFECPGRLSERPGRRPIRRAVRPQQQSNIRHP